jgi:hypothetical protein
MCHVLVVNQLIIQLYNLRVFIAMVKYIKFDTHLENATAAPKEPFNKPIYWI